MEDLSYSMALKIIASRQCNLPFLQTYIISDRKPVTLLTTTNDSKLQILHSPQKSIKEIFERLLKESNFKPSKSAEPIICYAINKKERTRMQEKDIKELMTQNAKPPINYIQPARPHSDDFEVYYILRLEYTKTQYISHFFKQVNYEKHAHYDSRLFESAADIANSIMFIIENHSKKRVMILEIEYLEDYDRKLWVSFMREVKIAEPVLCMHYIIKTPDDLKVIPVKSTAITKFSKLTSGQHVVEKKGQLRPPMDYTFVKGHIRNRKSDLATDLSISVPEGRIRKVEPISRMMVRSISIKRSGIKSPNASPSPRISSRLESRRARALRDEIMKSPELKTKYRLAGLIGILGIEMKKNFQRSLSESRIEQEEKKKLKKKKRPKSRLVLREDTKPGSRSVTPKFVNHK